MQEQGTARRGGAAFIWRWGAIAGVTLGVIQTLLSLSSLGLLKTILELLVWLLGFFVLGLFAARHTGRVGTGALVGLVTGLIGGLIAVLFGIIQLAANGPEITQAIHHAQQQDQGILSSPLRAIAIVGIVIGLIVTVAIELGLGAGTGAVGGLVERRQAPPVASTPVAETLWTEPPSPHPQPLQPPGPKERQE
jgi:hypothetical protein